MRRLRMLAWLILLAALGAAALGLVWFAGAALPYPDPTPAMLIRQQEELAQAQGLLGWGLLIGLVLAVWLWKTRPGAR